MSMAAAAPDVSDSPDQPPGLFWVFSVFLAPVAAALTVWSMSDGGNHWILAGGATAVLYAGLYAALVRFAGLSPRSAVSGYFLTALLTVPWGYAVAIGALYYTCAFTDQCPFS